MKPLTLFEVFFKIMDKSNIPKALHFLIPLAEECGIGDDGYRDEKNKYTSNEELAELVKYFNDTVSDDFNKCFGNPNLVEPQTQEYYIF